MKEISTYFHRNSFGRINEEENELKGTDTGSNRIRSHDEVILDQKSVREPKWSDDEGARNEREGKTLSRFCADHLLDWHWNTKLNGYNSSRIDTIDKIDTVDTIDTYEEEKQRRTEMNHLQKDQRKK